ncbi:ANTAR domain-containing response regulator [Phosphitispora fastidiosa]|uniref:ANTAR domain-containing response regulator n=1 Tax=Phosphitispora fastidiosa TaxID=2837202 RepID=UPI001E6474D6|nr:ANTAR domain-containing protein [Phosphitispora fastidiosa]MBU7008399.1 response regulator NasT [Phosphitispora fastidiosa]
MGEARVVIADPDAQSRKALKAILNQAGHLVTGEAEDGLTALKLIRTRQPDLVILDARMAVMDGSEFAYIVEEDGLAPIILLTSGDQFAIQKETDEQQLFAYAIKPVTEQSLLPVIDIVIKNYTRIRTLEQEVSRLKDVIATRKLVEKAKGILMDSYKLTESEAFKRIQKQSMNKRVSMKSVAKAIILAHEINM